MNDIQNELNILDEINKGATMGIDAIKEIKPKVQDRNFLNVLDSEENKYVCRFSRRKLQHLFPP